jgi:hypothetical protein
MTRISSWKSLFSDYSSIGVSPSQQESTTASREHGSWRSEQRVHIISHKHETSRESKVEVTHTFHLKACSQQCTSSIKAASHKPLWKVSPNRDQRERTLLETTTGIFLLNSLLHKAQTPVVIRKKRIQILIIEPKCVKDRKTLTIG